MGIGRGEVLVERRKVYEGQAAEAAKGRRVSRKAHEAYHRLSLHEDSPF